MGYILSKQKCTALPNCEKNSTANVLTLAAVKYYRSVVTWLITVASARLRNNVAVILHRGFCNSDFFDGCYSSLTLYDHIRLTMHGLCP